MQQVVPVPKQTRLAHRTRRAAIPNRTLRTISPFGLHSSHSVRRGLRLLYAILGITISRKSMLQEIIEQSESLRSWGTIEIEKTSMQSRVAVSRTQCEGT